MLYRTACIRVYFTTQDRRDSDPSLKLSSLLALKSQACAHKSPAARTPTVMKSSYQCRRLVVRLSTL